MSKIVLDGAIDLHCHFGPESVIGVPHSVDAFEAVTGRGVKGRIDGQLFYLANHRLIVG